MIYLEHLYKTFNEGSPSAFEALVDVSLHVNKGECVLLQGASGSGKSTLLGLTAGLYQPSAGRVILDGETFSGLPEHFACRLRRQKIGILFQQFHLVGTLSVLQNLALPTLPDQKEHQQTIHALLERFGLTAKQHALAQTLSGGEQQRVALMRALVNDPAILLADEPSANLDEALTQTLLDFFETLKQEGKTLLIATHDPVLLAWKGAERIVGLEKGRLL